jgi:F0F1-type ATP synthase epsilon subunit
MPNDLQNQKNLKVQIRSRSKSYFDDMAYSLTSVNGKGVFDVLPYHANFVTLIKDKLIVDKGLPSEVELPLEKGVLNVKGDKIDVYLGF